MRRQLRQSALNVVRFRLEKCDLLRCLYPRSLWAFMLKFLLLRNTKVVGENHRLWPVLRQPTVGRVAHNSEGPRASIDGTETLDAAKRTQRCILHDVFGVV